MRATALFRRRTGAAGLPAVHAAVHPSPREAGVRGGGSRYDVRIEHHDVRVLPVWRSAGGGAETAYGGMRVEIGAMVIAVAGVAGTLGGALLTQRGSERAKRREIELVRGHEEVRESLTLRRGCYATLNRDARQFTTALNRHLHVMRDRGVEDADRDALEAAKSAHRDSYSEAQMIAPDAVLERASAVNRALNAVYGQVKRLEREAPEAGETMATVSRAQHDLWELTREMRAAMRADVGVSSG